ncbi:UXT-like protein [Jimgerdemannia flammicorona]|uniref:UXT-like protein n=1 Tax=Jimgerdemannia flammicorona TaxID=994334 RepID=A0A433DBG1_9FUNG|nr:UXT-like protein [Jimgerdemannia flammicorona]
MPPKDPSTDTEPIAVKLAKYDKFVNDKLKVDLQKTLEARDKLYDTISEYLKLKSQIEVIQENNLKEMKTMVDLGSNFYVQAKIPDTTYIYVNVGFGFHVQMTLEEAKNFVGKKEAQLQKRADKHTEEAAKIRANIKLVLEAMSEILQLEGKQAPRYEPW